MADVPEDTEVARKGKKRSRRSRKNAGGDEQNAQDPAEEGKENTEEPAPKVKKSEVAAEEGAQDQSKGSKRKHPKHEGDASAEEQEPGSGEATRRPRKEKKAKKHRGDQEEDESEVKPPCKGAQESSSKSTASAPSREDQQAPHSADTSAAASEPKRNPYLPASRPAGGQPVDRRLPTFSFGRPRRKLNLAPTEAHTVFAGMLPYGCDRHSLEKHFAACGLVTRSTLLRRPDGSFSGAALVDFATLSAAEKAVRELNGSQLQGRSIRVDLGSKPGTNAAPSSATTDAPPQAAAEASAAGAPAPAAAAATDPGATHSVHLSWFGDAVPEEEIRTVFGKAGAILAVKMVAKAGFGFVDYGTQGEAQAALELDGVAVGDSKVRVQLKQGKKKNKAKAGDQQPQQAPPQPEPKSTVVAAQRTGAIVAPAGKAVKFDSDSE